MGVVAGGRRGARESEQWRGEWFIEMCHVWAVPWHIAYMSKPGGGGVVRR